MRLTKIFIPLLCLVLTSCGLWDNFLLIWPFQPDVCGKTIPITEEIKDLREKAKTSVEIEKEVFNLAGNINLIFFPGTYCPECKCIESGIWIQKKETFIPDKRFNIKKIWLILENDVWIPQKIEIVENHLSERTGAVFVDNGPQWPQTKSSGKTENKVTVISLFDYEGKEYLLKQEGIPIRVTE